MKSKLFSENSTKEIKSNFLKKLLTCKDLEPTKTDYENQYQKCHELLPSQFKKKLYETNSDGNACGLLSELSFTHMFHENFKELGSINPKYKDKDGYPDLCFETKDKEKVWFEIKYKTVGDSNNPNKACTPPKCKVYNAAINKQPAQQRVISAVQDALRQLNSQFNKGRIDKNDKYVIVIYLNEVRDSDPCPTTFFMPIFGYSYTETTNSSGIIEYSKKKIYIELKGKDNDKVYLEGGLFLEEFKGEGWKYKEEPIPLIPYISGILIFPFQTSKFIKLLERNFTVNNQPNNFYYFMNENAKNPLSCSIIKKFNLIPPHPEILWYRTKNGWEHILNTLELSSPELSEIIEKIRLEKNNHTIIVDNLILMIKEIFTLNLDIHDRLFYQIRIMLESFHKEVEFKHIEKLLLMTLYIRKKLKIENGFKKDDYLILSIIQIIKKKTLLRCDKESVGLQEEILDFLQEKINDIDSDIAIQICKFFLQPVSISKGLIDTNIGVYDRHANIEVRKKALNQLQTIFLNDHTKKKAVFDILLSDLKSNGEQWDILPDIINVLRKIRKCTSIDKEVKDKIADWVSGIKSWTEENHDFGEGVSGSDILKMLDKLTSEYS